MKNDDSPDNAYQNALRLMKQGQIQRAEIILRGLISQLPREIRNHEAMLTLLFAQGRIEEAIDHTRGVMGYFKLTKDPIYQDFYLEALRATTTSPMPLRRILRFHELVRQLQRVVTLSGDIAECGCYRGMSSFLLCSYLRHHDVQFDGSGYHIFDSFQGLSAPTSEDDIPADDPNVGHLSQMMGAGHFAASLNTVQHNLSAFPRIAYHSGWIPLTFERLPERKYRFVHVDVDLYDPTWSCLEYFYPRMMAGAVLVSDDHSWPGARKAIEEFCAEKSVAFAVSKYGQAIIDKST